MTNPSHDRWSFELPRASPQLSLSGAGLRPRSSNIWNAKMPLTPSKLSTVLSKWLCKARILS